MEYQEACDAASRAQDAYYEARTHSQNSDEAQKLNGLREDERNLLHEVSEAQKKLSRFSNASNDLTYALKRSEELGFTPPLELYPAYIQSMPPDRRGTLQVKLEQYVKKTADQLDSAHLDLAIQAKAQTEKREELHRRIEILSSGRLVYPDHNRAQQVKDKINQALSAQGMEPDAKILCDILSMTEPSWQDCVEACLGSRRFDILIPKNHYPAAKYAYTSMGAAVGQVSLLDSPALERDLASLGQEPLHSLASKVTSENRLAKAYISHMLGNIICCDCSDDLERHSHSATRDLLRHFPYRLARLKKPQNFIGQEARRHQLEEIKKEYDQVNREQNEIKSRLTRYKEVHNQFVQILQRNTLSDLYAGWDSQTVYERRQQQYQYIHSQIESMEHNPILLGLYQRTEFLHQELERKDKAKQELYSKKDAVEKKAQAYQSRQQAVIDEAAAAEALWVGYTAAHASWQADIEKRYEGATQKHDTPAQIVRAQQDQQTRFDKALNEYVTVTLIPLQQAYNQRYTCDYLPGSASIDQYLELYQHLTNVELEHHLSSLQAAKQRCKERFRQEILYRLSDEIDNAKRRFRELNRVMDQLSYGEERYCFTIGPSEDPRLEAFYRLITNPANKHRAEEGTIEALMQPENAVYESQIDDLMERILADVKYAAELRQQGKHIASTQLSEYVDYRCYLCYDIQVTNTVTHETVPISAVSGDSSGGENQVPFYIAICASLLQIYQKCDNSIRLILLDEAFNKMTSDRIKPMMEMLRSMQLQVVLITTVEKASAIYPYCDVTHSIVKIGSRNAVQPFYLEQEESTYGLPE